MSHPGWWGGKDEECLAHITFGPTPHLRISHLPEERQTQKNHPEKWVKSRHRHPGKHREREGTGRGCVVTISTGVPHQAAPCTSRVQLSSSHWGQSSGENTRCAQSSTRASEDAVSLSSSLRIETNLQPEKHLELSRDMVMHWHAGAQAHSIAGSQKQKQPAGPTGSGKTSTLAMLCAHPSQSC